AYRSFGGEVEASSTPTICRLSDSRRHQLWAIALDDIQMGCGRTGTFFSFEIAALSPDVVVLSKSLSGYGLPLSMLLIKDELDGWERGEHAGTFRGNNLALVVGTAAIDIYWRDELFKSNGRETFCIVNSYPLRLNMGMVSPFVGKVWCLDLIALAMETAEMIARKAFENGLMIERCGPNDQVVKFLPSLTITARR
ncbi:aminotransferase class III-fold pyridoxal phosphate-dependent enzyme, partial [Bradyrhizobium sp. 188]|uniref:aminotransferase class III-fold pyridoxal phosphate-dependent enzyme n=1 Tax=Bradyrhizobium sp. 188 TaxID=2782656 RepID=UPI001FFBFA0D